MEWSRGNGKWHDGDHHCYPISQHSKSSNSTHISKIDLPSESNITIKCISFPGGALSKNVYFPFGRNLCRKKKKLNAKIVCRIELNRCRSEWNRTKALNIREFGFDECFAEQNKILLKSGLGLPVPMAWEKKLNYFAMFWFTRIGLPGFGAKNERKLWTWATTTLCICRAI